MAYNDGKGDWWVMSEIREQMKTMLNDKYAHKSDLDNMLNGALEWLEKNDTKNHKIARQAAAA